MTYTEQLERQKARREETERLRKESTAKFPARVAALAKAMRTLPTDTLWGGKPWTAGLTHDWSARLTRSDGIVLSVSHDAYKDRITISASPPNPEAGGMNGHSVYLAVLERDQVRPDASFAAKRFDENIAAIARAVDRKVVQPYEPIYAKILAYNSQLNDCVDKAVATYAKLLEITGAKAHASDVEKLRNGERVTLFFHNYAGRVTVQSYGSVSINLDGLVAAEGIKLVSLIVEATAGRSD